MPEHETGPPARPWYDLVIERIAIKGWSVSELAQRAGVGRPTIYGWRDNLRRPQARPVNAVADVLGIDRRRANVLAGVIPAPEVPAALRDVVRRTVAAENQQRVLDAISRAMTEDEPPSPRDGEDGPPRRERLG